MLHQHVAEVEDEGEPVRWKEVLNDCMRGHDRRGGGGSTEWAPWANAAVYSYISTVTVDKHVYYSFHRHAVMTSVRRATVDDVTRLVEFAF